MKKKRKARLFTGTASTAIIHKPVEPYASFVDAASEDDRKWFESHPGTDERIRDYMAGEFRSAVPPTDHRVIVHQIRPGTRIRTAASPEEVQLAESGVWVMSDAEMRIREIPE